MSIAVAWPCPGRRASFGLGGSLDTAAHGLRDQAGERSHHGRPNPPNTRSSNGERWVALGYRMSGTKQHHGPRAAVTKVAQLGKHGLWGHQASLLPSAVRDKDAKGATQDPWFPQAEPGRETSFAWGHPPPASPGQGALPMSIRPSTRTLTGWPWSGSTSRQLLFSHRQLWESWVGYCTPSILPSRPWFRIRPRCQAPASIQSLQLLSAPKAAEVPRQASV